MGHLATLNFSLKISTCCATRSVDLRRTRLPRGLRRSKKRTFSRPISRKLGDLGVLGLTVGEEYGGAQLGYLAHMVAIASLGSRRLVLRCSFELVRQPTAPQWRRRAEGEVSTQLVSGEHVGALAMSEPNAGSDVVSMKLRAEKKGDRYVRLEDAAFN